MPTADATVVLVGTLDTKGRQYAYLRAAIEAAGPATILVDAGVLGEPQVAVVSQLTPVCRTSGAPAAQLEAN